MPVRVLPESEARGSPLTGWSRGAREHSLADLEQWVAAVTVSRRFPCLRRSSLPELVPKVLYLCEQGVAWQKSGRLLTGDTKAISSNTAAWGPVSGVAGNGAGGGGLPSGRLRGSCLGSCAQMSGSRSNAEGRRQAYLGRAVTVFRLLYGDRSRTSRWLSSITVTAPAPRLFSLLACAGSCSQYRYRFAPFRTSCARSRETWGGAVSGCGSGGVAGVKAHRVDAHQLAPGAAHVRQTRHKPAQRRRLALLPAVHCVRPPKPQAGSK